MEKAACELLHFDDATGHLIASSAVNIGGRFVFAGILSTSKLVLLRQTQDDIYFACPTFEFGLFSLPEEHPPLNLAVSPDSLDVLLVSTCTSFIIPVEVLLSIHCLVIGRESDQSGVKPFSVNGTHPNETKSPIYRSGLFSTLLHDFSRSSSEAVISSAILHNFILLMPVAEPDDFAPKEQSEEQIEHVKRAERIRQQSSTPSLQLHFDSVTYAADKGVRPCCCWWTPASGSILAVIGRGRDLRFIQRISLDLAERVSMAVETSSAFEVQRKNALGSSRASHHAAKGDNFTNGNVHLHMLPTAVHKYLEGCDIRIPFSTVDSTMPPSATSTSHQDEATTYDEKSHFQISLARVEALGGHNPLLLCTVVIHEGERQRTFSLIIKHAILKASARFGAFENPAEVNPTDRSPLWADGVDLMMLASLSGSNVNDSKETGNHAETNDRSRLLTPGCRSTQGGLYDSGNVNSFSLHMITCVEYPHEARVSEDRSYFSSEASTNEIARFDDDGALMIFSLDQLNRMSGRQGTSGLSCPDDGSSRGCCGLPFQARAVQKQFLGVPSSAHATCTFHPNFSSLDEAVPPTPDNVHRFLVTGSSNGQVSLFRRFVPPQSPERKLPADGATSSVFFLTSCTPVVAWSQCMAIAQLVRQPILGVKMNARSEQQSPRSVARFPPFKALVMAWTASGVFYFQHNIQHDSKSTMTHIEAQTEARVCEPYDSTTDGRKTSQSDGEVQAACALQEALAQASIGNFHSSIHIAESALRIREWRTRTKVTEEQDADMSNLKARREFCVWNVDLYHHLMGWLLRLFRTSQAHANDTVESMQCGSYCSMNCFTHPKSPLKYESKSLPDSYDENEVEGDDTAQLFQKIEQYAFLCSSFGEPKVIVSLLLRGTPPLPPTREVYPSLSPQPWPEAITNPGSIISLGFRCAALSGLVSYALDLVTGETCLKGALLGDGCGNMVSNVVTSLHTRSLKPISQGVLSQSDALWLLSQGFGESLALAANGRWVRELGIFARIPVCLVPNDRAVFRALLDGPKQSDRKSKELFNKIIPPLPRSIRLRAALSSPCAVTAHLGWIEDSIANRRFCNTEVNFVLDSLVIMCHLASSYSYLRSRDDHVSEIVSSLKTSKIRENTSTNESCHPDAAMALVSSLVALTKLEINPEARSGFRSSIHISAPVDESTCAGDALSIVLGALKSRYDLPFTVARLVDCQLWGHAAQALEAHGDFTLGLEMRLIPIIDSFRQLSGNVELKKRDLERSLIDLFQSKVLGQVSILSSEMESDNDFGQHLQSLGLILATWQQAELATETLELCLSKAISCGFVGGCAGDSLKSRNNRNVSAQFISAFLQSYKGHMPSFSKNFFIGLVSAVNENLNAQSNVEGLVLLYRSRVEALDLAFKSSIPPTHVIFDSPISHQYYREKSCEKFLVNGAFVIFSCGHILKQSDVLKHKDVSLTPPTERLFSLRKQPKGTSNELLQKGSALNRARATVEIPSRESDMTAQFRINTANPQGPYSSDPKLSRPVTVCGFSQLEEYLNQRRIVSFDFGSSPSLKLQCPQCDS